MAEQKGITVLNADLPETQSMSVMSQSGNCYIGMDTKVIRSEREERMHLAHELGHCVQGAFYNPYAIADIRKKHEKRADKWAIRRLIPQDEWNDALKDGYTEVWELAEYFDVSEDFIRKAHELYSAS